MITRLVGRFLYWVAGGMVWLADWVYPDDVINPDEARRLAAAADDDEGYDDFGDDHGIDLIRCVRCTRHGFGTENGWFIVELPEPPSPKNYWCPTCWQAVGSPTDLDRMFMVTRRQLVPGRMTTEPPVR